MRRMITTAALCLTACLALTGVASAFTAPEFTEKAAPNTTAASVPFATTMGVTYLKGVTSDIKVQCTSGTGVGEATSAKVADKVTLLLTGCEIESLGYPCENQSAGTKEIDTDLLEGELGNVTTTKPGLRLYSEAQGNLANSPSSRAPQAASSSVSRSPSSAILQEITI